MEIPNLLLIIVLFGFREIHSYSLGPPIRSCQSMFPGGHRLANGETASPQTSSSPYTISINQTTYNPGETLEVLVNATGLHDVTYFMGIFVQARRTCPENVDVSVGSFMVQDGEDYLGTLDCNGNAKSAVAHTNKSSTSNKMFYWKAPSTAIGHIIFTGTFVQRKLTFWTNVKSVIVQDATKSASWVCSSAWRIATDKQIYAVILVYIFILITDFAH